MIKQLLKIVSVVIIITLIIAPQDLIARKPMKTHKVTTGDSVAKVADYYGVSQRDLCSINKLRKGKPLKLGQQLKIPNVLRVAGKQYKVKSGDNLAKLATKFHRSVSDIANANKLKKNSPLKVGQTIVIPDKNSANQKINTKKNTPTPILFLRIRTGERKKIQLYNKNGVMRKNGVSQLSYLSRDKIGNKVKRLNKRLIYMIQQVAFEYPGKAIEIISGYREQTTGNESQHAFGRALDFRIHGVPGRKLFNFCKSLPRAGCGLYPNDNFIHMDAREKKTTWIEH